MSTLEKKEFKNGDLAVLYVTTCSDVDTSFKHGRKFVECYIVGKICSIDKEHLDDRYIVRCAEDLRDESYKGGLYAYEALVNVNSPFLMTTDEFEEYRDNPIAKEDWLEDIGNLIIGFDVPEHLEKWQTEVWDIMLALGIDNADEVFDDIKEDFESGRMDIDRF